MSADADDELGQLIDGLWWKTKDSSVFWSAELSYLKYHVVDSQQRRTVAKVEDSDTASYIAALSPNNVSLIIERLKALEQVARELADEVSGYRRDDSILSDDFEDLIRGCERPNEWFLEDLLGPQEIDDDDDDLDDDEWLSLTECEHELQSLMMRLSAGKMTYGPQSESRTGDRLPRLRLEYQTGAYVLVVAFMKGHWGIAEFDPQGQLAAHGRYSSHMTFEIEGPDENIEFAQTALSKVEPALRDIARRLGPPTPLS